MLRKLALGAATLIGLMHMAPAAVAQEFPTKQPLKIIVPVPAGGSADVMARITAEFLRQRLGQTVVVDNKPGASSTIGINFVAKAPADGYTILFVGPEFAVVPAVRKSMPYTYNDFTYLARPFRRPSVLVTAPKHSATNLQGLIADMKARPGQVGYGSTGNGAIVHMGIALFESAAGVKGLHVPYAGMAPILNDLRAGTVDFTMTGPPIPDGMKALGVGSPNRDPQFPQVPTFEEQGIRGANWDVWWGFFAPAQMPRAVTERLTNELLAIFRDPAAQAKFAAAGGFIPEATPLTGESFKRQVLDDHRRWKEIAERLNIVLE
jgi:tripartite-type tricarboxylate transporter receptor subunit TctC